ncbi:MAG: flavodoxin family protein [Candidatus Hodarchaeota archaeon]
MIIVVSIPVLVASPQGEKGETAIIANEFVEELTRVGFRAKIQFTPKMSFAACGGCQECEPEGLCIVKDDVQDLQAKIVNSPAFVLATPVYLMGPPGRLKCLLDRFWPWTLRPQLFGKYATTIVTAGHFGALSVAEYLTSILESWGLQVISPLTVIYSSKDKVAERKKALVNSRLLARRFIETMEKKKRMGLSSQGKRFISQIWSLIQGNREQFQNSYNFWIENNIPKQIGI